MQKEGPIHSSRASLDWHARTHSGYVIPMQLLPLYALSNKVIGEGKQALGKIEPIEGSFVP